MNKLTIFIIITIFVIILLHKIYNIKRLGSYKLEHLTTNSDEAIQNVASLYNKDNFAIGKLKLGDRWIISGVGHNGENDDIFRVYNSDNSLAKIKAGHFTAAEINDMTMNGPVKVYVDSKDDEVKGQVKNDLNSTTTNLKGYVTAEINDMNAIVKAVNEKISKQDLSSVYKNGQVTADKVLIGGKWLLIGGDDGVIRIHRVDGSGLAKMELGEFTSGQLIDKSMNGPVKAYVDTKYNSMNNELNKLQTTVNTTLDNKINSFSSTLDGKINEMKTTYDTKINDLANQIKNVDVKHGTDINKLDKNISELGKFIKYFFGR